MQLTRSSSIRPVVLVVEDAPEVRTTLCRILEHRGFTTIPAADGRSALQLAEQHRIDVLVTVDLELRDCLTVAPLRARVERLRCFRGIDDLTALTIAAELGDARRFPSAPRAMAFMGLTPSEHSSGTKRVRGTITKTGNAHLRRVLVESAWHYRHHPFLGRALRLRQHGAAPTVIDQAWHAQQRLHRRYRRLAARGKPK